MSNPFDQMAASLTADRSPERVDLQEHMAALIAEHGSMNKAAHAVGMEVSEFCRVYHRQRPGSDAVLQMLGLRRVTYYEKL